MSRPTLSQVLEREAYKLILQQMPSILTYTPNLLSAAEIFVQMPPDENNFRAVEPLIDVFLQAMVEGQPLTLTSDHVFTTKRDGRMFHDLTTNNGHIIKQVTLDPSRLNTALAQLQSEALRHFSQAHVAYWNASNYEDATFGGISRHQWLSEILRVGMACNLRSARLSEGQRKCLEDLLLGNSGAFELLAVEACMTRDGESFNELQAELLVHASDEVGQVWLWCHPDGRVEGFDDLASFGDAFDWAMARRYRFDALSWRRYQLEGDVFLQQSGLILQLLLGKVTRLQTFAFDSVDALETHLFSLTDPGVLMLDLDCFEQNGAGAELPAVLTSGSSRRRLSAWQALIDLGLKQAKASNATSVEGIEGPYTYAERRLRERGRELHPESADLAPSDLLIMLETQEGSDSVNSTTLTEWAVNKHLALNGKKPVSVRHRVAGTSLASWVTPAALESLIDDVDVGGYYPMYVKQKLDDPAMAATRSSRFAQEWRQQLLASGLMAWARRALSEARWQALAEFCLSGKDFKVNVDIAPLTFTVRNLRQGDEATYMFVLRFHEPAFALLYCPHYEQDALTSADDLAGLMVAIKGSPDLQSRILEWLSPAARATYDNGGFKTPHLTQGVGLPPDQLPIVDIGQVEISFKPWLADIDHWVYMHRRSMIIRLADSGTVSNSEQRWARIAELVGIMTQLTAMLPGPIGAAARTLLAIKGLHTLLDEHTYLSQAALHERVLSRFLDMAWQLLLDNALAEVDAAVAAPRVDIDGMPLTSVRGTISWAESSQGASYLVGELERRPAQVVMIRTGWGAGPVARRRALSDFAAKVTLSATTLDVKSNVHSVNGNNFILMDGVPYQVRRDGDELRIVSANGQLGPALWRGTGGVWQIKVGLFGGTGREKSKTTRIDKAREDVQRKVARHKISAVQLQKDFQASLGSLIAKEDEIKREQVRRNLTQSNPGGSLSEQQVNDRIAAIDLKVAAMQVEMSTLQLDTVTLKERVVSEELKLGEQLNTQIKLTPEDQKRGMELKRDEWLGFTLTDALYVRDEMLRLSDRMALHDTAASLNGRRMVEIAKELADYRRRLSDSTRLVARALVAMQTVDDLLVQLPASTDFYHADKKTTVGNFIQSRHLNIIDLHVEHLIALAELAFNPSKVKSLPRWHKAIRQLSGQGLRAAAAGHADVLTSDLSSDDRAEVLQEAWHQYSMASYRASRQIAVGGALVSTDMLNAYRQQLEVLKESVSKLLKEDGRGSAYPLSEDVRKAVRTADGRLVIATEQMTDEGAQLVVTNFDNTVVHRFRKDAGEWKEVLPEVDALDPLPSALSEVESLAQAVLEEGDALHKLAQEYVEQDLDHRDLNGEVDLYISRLEQARDAIINNDALRQRLIAAVDTCKANKVRWLTQLHSGTAKPGAAALAFLHQQGLLNITYVRREVTRAGDVFDEYQIKLLSEAGAEGGKPLWAAHFHLASQDADAADFTVGHLKLWRERKFGKADEQKLREAGRILHRGRLGSTHVAGIIPFNP
jgi:hypothetical protein